MTSHELARQLLAGPDKPVHMAYQYGDYWHTTVAPEITEVAEGQVEHSEYHQTDKVIEEERDPSDKVRDVILLS